MRIAKTNFSTLTFLLLLILVNGCTPNFFENVVPKPEGADYFADQVEPSIAVSPKNSRLLIGGAVMNGFYYSKNRGKSWIASLVSSPYGVNGDPVLLADNFGNYFFFHLANSGKDHYLDRIVCQRTKKIGEPLQNVGHTAVNGKVHDKHWVCSDPKTGTLHMAWTQFDKYDSKDPLDSTIIVYSNSKDFGETWSTPQRISKLSGNCLDDSGTIEGVSICTGSTGEVYVVYCLNDAIFLNKSLDEGLTWLPHEIKIADQIGGWNFSIPGVYRVNGFPSLAIDKSKSKHNGRLYISWADQRLGASNTEIFISYSDDKGFNWSPAKSVYQNENHQYFSTMRIDQSTGNLAVFFYSQNNPNNFETEMILVTSVDGGKTFQDEKINTTPFRTQPEMFFGDYIGLDYNRKWIHLLWPEQHQGRIVLKYGRLRK